jgi:hypothetical protein
MHTSIEKQIYLYIYIKENYILDIFSRDRKQSLLNFSYSFQLEREKKVAWERLNLVIIQIYSLLAITRIFIIRVEI